MAGSCTYLLLRLAIGYGRLRGICRRPSEVGRGLAEDGASFVIGTISAIIVVIIRPKLGGLLRQTAASCLASRLRQPSDYVLALIRPSSVLLVTMTASQYGRAGHGARYLGILELC